MIQDWDDWFRQLDAGGSVQIRPMHGEDTEEVLRVIRLHDTDDYRAAQQTFGHHDFAPPFHRAGYLVAIDDDRPVGVSGYYIDDLETQGIYWLDWTYVNPFFQGEGIGSALFRAVIETVEVLGARKLYISTSSLPKYEPALNFYQSHGFQLEGRLSDYYASGEDKLILGQALDAIDV